MTPQASFTHLSADDSADFLRLSLKARIPFFFTKYGDGALECIYGGGGNRTRDNEFYSPELGAALLRSWDVLNSNGVNLYLADWLSTSFDAKNTGRHEEKYRLFTQDARPLWLHYDAVLLDRQSARLVEFYKAVKRDTRRKVIMGPPEWRPAMKMLDAEGHIVTPMKDLFFETGRLSAELAAADPEILLYGAGMAGTIPVIEQWKRRPDATYINLGSALDPLFRCHSRMNQLRPDIARRFFRSIL